MIITVWHPAAEGERFAPDAFAGQIGQETAYRAADGTASLARVVAAEVVDGGAGVNLTIDVPDLVLPEPPRDRLSGVYFKEPPPYSFAAPGWSWVQEDDGPVDEGVRRLLADPVVREALRTWGRQHGVPGVAEEFPDDPPRM